MYQRASMQLKAYVQLGELAVYDMSVLYCLHIIPRVCKKDLAPESDVPIYPTLEVSVRSSTPSLAPFPFPLRSIC
ncbi:hypothetical protein KQX54_015177 [Cotesia glomerata]|uniref:Uncharacterized protein n=1 Tax=Cotesia glomerata TaxID=32391 RepID=A0AAV7HEL8_COTGL|nr:hypothetical protein KQX54_015177 [Cotesia glomerata]